MAAAVRPRACRHVRRGDPGHAERAGARPIARSAARGDPAAVAFASFTNVFAWMGFGTIAMKFVTVGEGALAGLHDADPWAMLFAWPVLQQPPDAAGSGRAGALGVAGVALLLGGSGFAFSADKLTGIALALGLRHSVRARQCAEP